AVHSLHSLFMATAWSGVHSITYNMLNLPQTILFNDGHETRYTYAADGRKLRVQYLLNNFAIFDGEEAEDGGEDGVEMMPFSLASTNDFVVGGGSHNDLEEAVTTLMVRDYCGNKEYRNGVLDRIHNDYGYWHDGGYFFYVKDNRGDVRVVLDQNNQPVELNSYYPYGSLMAATTAEGVQSRKYGTKELDRENGLDWYDSQARMYDPMIGRTTSLDPKAEKYYSISPYAWCANNPINNIDLNGDTIIFKENQTIFYYMKVGDSYGFYDANGKKYDGKNSFVSELTNALQSIKDKEVGNSLIEAVNGSSFNVQIATGGHNSTLPDGSAVLWNPKNESGGIDVLGKVKRPAYIGLAHELAHVWDKINQLTDGVWTIIKGDNDSKVIYNSDKYATAIENLIREEHKIPLRKFYSHDSDGNPIRSTVLLGKKNINKFYTIQQLLQTLKQKR
ncbi:MAG: RHS repeat-associated core domain-containing protein, partial [Clostridia bacterium]|nr:RHS repeat-associated core domain-containing protein [Clostridia bacterium]